ncbi:MAG: hypothetical protein U1E62_18495 [Alsobacter sp.]
MHGIDRRAFLAGIVAVAATPASASPPALQPVHYPLVPALPPLEFDLLKRLLKSFVKWSGVANHPGLSEEMSVLYQHMAGRRYCMMSWPHADAPERLAALTREWPRLKPNIDLVIAARIEGRTDWPWDYSRVRIDGGPPVS